MGRKRARFTIDEEMIPNLNTWQECKSSTEWTRNRLKFHGKNWQNKSVCTATEE